MRFPHLRYNSTRFVHPNGDYWRDYPMCNIGVGSGSVFHAHPALFDTGADDTVFPLALARQLGIDLSNAPTGEASGVAGAVIPIRYATVVLRLADNVERAEWTAIVGFAALGRPYALLGQTGFHQFFDVLYRGEARETVVTPTAAFPGSTVRP